MQGFVGTQLCTTAAGQAVGPLGAKVRVYVTHLISGGTAGIIKLYNGTTTSGTLFYQKTAAAVHLLQPPPSMLKNSRFQITECSSSCIDFV